MLVAEISQPGPPGVLRWVSRARPEPGPGEVLLRVRAFGINRPDILQRKGLYPPPPGASDIPGLEVCADVVGGDLAGSALRSGQRVCALLTGGGYAEYCVAPAGQCLPVPEGLSDAEAAALPETFFTVWHNAFERGALKPGELILVQGGSSGIGTVAIQLAHALGSRVWATAGSEAKCQACLALGAEGAINYRTQDFVEQVREHTSGRGVDVILDMVAGDYVAREMACLAEDGRLVVIAVQGGTAAAFDAALLMRRRLSITGSTLRARSVEFKSRLAEALRKNVWPLLESGRVRPQIHAVLPAEQIAQAHAMMEGGQHIGKIVLTWS
ncbi:MAG: NAD(P)H-quinone oxidoreductase [Betaproteobacteria bacterium]|uniref:NAD(P)H-quinone oxidoreductase n=1 Tax=Thiomonas sp. TaxID=2047785 RepID=UPI00238448FD|nr:NAD(P)H-quinone oxidoreductase [Thiomonas sp.]MDE2128929.1 NAD(P)H-quinone oxidoreductase [Betaproteobacteria bacterium]